MFRPKTKSWMSMLAAGGMAIGASLAASPAHAACGTFAISSLTPSFSEQCGDKTFSNFVGVSLPAGTVSLVDGGLTHTLRFDFSSPYVGYTPIPYTFTYQVQLAGAPGTLWIDSLNTAQLATGNPSTPISSLIASPAIGVPGPTLYTLTASLGFDAASTDFNQYITQWDNYIYQKTPAPLPILGAGAAFGFSRKLRKRIKSAA